MTGHKDNRSGKTKQHHKNKAWGNLQQLLKKCFKTSGKFSTFCVLPNVLFNIKKEEHERKPY